MENYRPRIILSAAITLDGKLATRTGDSKLSSKKTKLEFTNLEVKLMLFLLAKKLLKLMIHCYLCEELRRKIQFVLFLIQVEP